MSAIDSGQDAGQSDADRDGQIIANQEREIARIRGERELAEDAMNEFGERVGELFNPPDDDAWHPLTSVEAAAEFIEQTPCECTAEQIEDFDACPRCKVLGRIGNETIGR